MPATIPIPSAVTVPTLANIATATIIDFRDAEGGRFFLASGSTVTLTWHHSMNGATFTPAYTEGNAAVTQTIAASRDYPIPASLKDSLYLKATGNVAGVLTIALKKTNANG